MTSIKSNVFYGCTSLKEITVDGNNPVYDSRENCNAIIETASGRLIRGCAATVIPSSVTSIGGGAFSGCASLAKIVIPASVTSIGERAFYGCTSLKEITVDENNHIYDSRDNCNAIIEKANGCLIQGCAATVIPSSVTSIGGWAFSGCTSLAKIVIPASVIYIGDWAFECCTSLKEIVIPDSVIEIGDCAFDGCSSLTRIVIPDSVTKIGDSVFEYCVSLTRIVIPDSVTEIWDGTFKGCTSLAKIVIPASVTYIKYCAFAGCASLKEIIVDENNPVYDSRENCNAIIETASGRLVQGCAATVIPSSVTEIGDWAFDGCTSLAKIVIPASVTSIGEGAFSRCTSLKEIVIPDSVTEIGARAFDGCTSLTEIYCLTTTPPEVRGFDLGLDKGDVTVYVPRESVGLYRSARVWKEYEIRPMPE